MRLEKRDPPIDLDRDHVLGPADAELTLVGLAFTNAADYVAAKIAIFIASLIAAVLGTIILYPRRHEESESELAEQSAVGCAI